MIYNYKKTYEGTKILSWLIEFLFICLVDTERDSIEEKDLLSLIWLGEAICKLLDYEASKKLFSFISSALVQNKNWMTCDFSLFLCLLLGCHLSSPDGIRRAIKKTLVLNSNPGEATLVLAHSGCDAPVWHSSVVRLVKAKNKNKWHPNTYNSLFMFLQIFSDV